MIQERTTVTIDIGEKRLERSVTDPREKEKRRKEKKPEETDQGEGDLALAASYFAFAPGYFVAQVFAVTPLLAPLPPLTLMPLQSPKPCASVGRRRSVTRARAWVRRGP